MVEHIYRSIVNRHDYELLLIALVLCLISSFVTVSLNERARSSLEKERNNWILLSAVSLGAGIWAVNLISIFAFDFRIPVAFKVPVLIAALLFPTLTAMIGFRVAVYNRVKRVRALAGLIVGAGIVGAHSLAVFAIDISGAIVWDYQYTIVAMFLGLGFSAAALIGMNKTHDVVRFCVSVGLLVAAICGTHFTAFSGMSFQADIAAGASIETLPKAYLIIGVSLITLVLLAFSLSYTFSARSENEGGRRENDRLRSLADAAFEGIVVMDAGGHIVAVNRSFVGLSGKRAAEIRGKNIRLFFEEFDGIDNVWSLTESDVYMQEAGMYTAEGKTIPVELRFRQATVEGEIQHVVVVRDLREKQAAEKQISYLSNYDMLTGLANRQVMMEALLKAVSVALSDKAGVAVLYIDVDGFKELNTITGQEGGDLLLANLATRLKMCASETDTVARLGADQFCIIQEKITQPEEASILAETICDHISKPFTSGISPVSVSVSIGIATVPGDTELPNDLLSYSEIAMKNAKGTAGNSYHFYEEALDKAQFQRRQLKNDLIGAIDRGEITLAFQPQFSAIGQNVIGFEALVRWKHPKRGIISPGEFIPLAEESGHIIELGKWIVYESCRAAALWAKPLTIAINLSPVQFQQDGLPEIIDAALQETGLSPDRLELEITEGVLIDDVEHALQVLGRLREMGAKLAMDDFGAGYASLSYLRRFPFDKLKIDQSFIRNLHDSEQSLCIVRGMIGLAHGLKVPVLAEGVETEAQYQVLCAEGCDEIQGYFLGKPKPISEYADVTGVDGGNTAASNIHIL